MQPDGLYKLLATASVAIECHEAGFTVALSKPMTSGAKSEGGFGKQDFVYIAMIQKRAMDPQPISHV